jgi:hypothetical protein
MLKRVQHDGTDASALLNGRLVMLVWIPCGSPRQNFDEKSE